MLLAQLPTLPQPLGGSGTTSDGASSSRSSSTHGRLDAAETRASASGAPGALAAAFLLAKQEGHKLPLAHRMLLHQIGCSPMSALCCASLWMDTAAAVVSMQQRGTTTSAPSSNSSISTGSTTGTTRVDAAATVHMYTELVYRLDLYNHLLNADFRASTSEQCQLLLLLVPALCSTPASAPRQQHTARK